jgi:hypothetical protein
MEKNQKNDDTRSEQLPIEPSQYTTFKDWLENIQFFKYKHTFSHFYKKNTFLSSCLIHI